MNNIENNQLGGMPKHTYPSVDITELLEAQRKLDKHILENKGITEYPGSEITLAAIVETSELANEVRCFKFWSNKEPSAKEVILEELADVLHFLLSLTNDMNDSGMPTGAGINILGAKVTKLKLDHDNIGTSPKAMSEKFCTIAYRLLNFTPHHAMEVLFIIGYDLGFTTEEIFEAYYAKNEINYQRQKDGY